jgi:hypothetical protein
MPPPVRRTVIVGRAGVDGVVEQLAHDRRRPLDDLAGGDLADQLARQFADRSAHARLEHGVHRCIVESGRWRRARARRSARRPLLLAQISHCARPRQAPEATARVSFPAMSEQRHAVAPEAGSEPQPAFVQAVADLGARREVKTSQPIYNAQGIKLLEGGVTIDQSLYDRLVSHRLSLPLDECIDPGPGVEAASLEAAARAAIARWPFFARVAPEGAAGKSLVRRGRLGPPRQAGRAASDAGARDATGALRPQHPDGLACAPTSFAKAAAPSSTFAKPRSPACCTTSACSTSPPACSIPKSG